MDRSATDKPRRHVPHHDIIVVGTRCAGAPLAMMLARKGYRVLGLDRARFPSDALSTHFLWPRTTRYLASWGLLDRLAATGCPLIELVTMHFGSVTLKGRPDAVDGVAAMYCPRRTVLDRLLVEAAREAGAEIREETTARDLLLDGRRVVGVRAVGPRGESIEERAAIVVGADGVFSQVARLAGAGDRKLVPSLTCGYYAYWSDVATDGVEFVVHHGRDNLVFPTHDGLTCVWAGRSHDQWSDYRADVEAGYFATLDPDILTRVRAGKRATPFRGTGKLPNFYRRASGEGWALVGDAAYHRDPLTGMGIGDAFLGATLLADAIDRAFDGNAPIDLSSYQHELEAKTHAVFEYTLHAGALRDPGAQTPLYARIAASSEATRQMMNVVSGVLPYTAFFSQENMARLFGGGEPRSAGAAG